ncbi:hypothetical protein G6F55_002128 [Rhizopus delemar]|uniref:HPP transmembrane region domain-containing protein n=3 Tax=Rhizopus TaxID=4842 RepID=I1CB25_RHIO9|nr:hypothetical protein RO3G_10365 [Rhizopus delemar RA 99-880]KAG1463877.1 hypothetical protein G6F55_002128 [Rhizopus delemar]KAG1591419.1 hypothetical protein G6F48_003301 [Rhizopus delemar]KAG1601625.1 hypothetical protein G6F47_003515 [Rhizopus delemar]KAG1642015.1 hypothetical protein G6F44_005257 [Rhizopus delemar]|eukprot:EIE85655.1 hypothetical protein RO3G_10365 [Rhizopus delemar RA 99-880]
MFTYSPSFKEYHTPMIVASFGAGAVLVYGAIDAPLAQPRNVIGGQTIGCIVGVIIAQLFMGIKQDWASEDQKTAVMWVAGASAMAISLVLMQLTKTVHPPAGATALIANTTENIIEIKWFYIGIVFLSAVLQVAIGCLINNIERKYPSYWWKPDHFPLQIDPTTAATVISFGDQDTASHHSKRTEEGVLAKMNSNQDADKDEESNLDTIQSGTSSILELDRAISILKIHSTKALTLKDQESLNSLIDKISTHSSASQKN